jgi:class 3 adenylate cyclase
MGVGGAADRSGSAYAVPEDLRRPGLLGRFPPEAERRYRAWLVEQTRPLVRVLAVPSIPIWVLIPFAARLWVDSAIDSRIYLLSFAVVEPVVLLTLLITRTPHPRLQFPVASTAVVVIAGVTFYAFYDLLATRSQAGLLASIIWFNMLALFVRAPFRTTVLLTALVTAMGASLLVASVRDLGTARADTWPYFALLFVDVVMVPGMALVNEQAMRLRYVDELVIARQQADLVASRALVRRYAPQAVVARLEHGDTTVDGAQRRRVTIFFADVVGFTELADRLDPEALAEIVNDYLGSVADIVERHGGTVNEFAGDGVMAIFGAPADMPPRDQALAALAAARELQQSLPGLSERWFPLGIERELQARVGINSGVVSVGTFGSAVRATYTGIGLQTNIAARIQAHCPPGSVLLSKTSWHLVSDTVRCEPRGEVEVKGVHFPIGMYEPVPTEHRRPASTDRTV